MTKDEAGTLNILSELGTLVYRRDEWQTVAGEHANMLCFINQLKDGIVRDISKSESAIEYINKIINEEE